MSDQRPVDLQPGSQLGPYKIEALLGKGGMGVVFRAYDQRLGRRVAIKVSQEVFTDRFDREARSFASLNHPNICTLYDVGPNYLVMELIEGESLAQRLKLGKLPIEQAMEYGIQTASALAAAHAKGITHRDLKPGNIMLAKSGVKVLDFGLAKSDEDETVTMPHAVVGTPAYMAPEQRLGKPCDPRTDIYAFGILLYEMVTGARPHLDEPPKSDGLPDKISHVVNRCLRSDPEERWQSARDLKAELEWIANEQTRPALAATPARRRLMWPLIAAASLAALAAGTWVYFPTLHQAKRVIYATILPPEKTSFAFAANSGPVVLSPDGAHMVFSATGEDGKSQLWIRALNAPDARPLSGTEGATFPFWSPDSRWIAFYSAGVLKKLDTHGGVPVALTRVAGPGVGGSWGKKGQIVFTATAFAPMLKVSADGGEPSIAVETDVAGRGFPWFLPDGEHFLFAYWVGAGRMTMRVGSLGSTTSSVIGEADSNSIYSDGHLLYLRGDSLMAQPFDLTSLRTTGEAAPVAEHVQRYMTLVGAGVFSASTTGLLAYQKGSDAALMQLTWFDRSGKALSNIGEPKAYFDLEFSPDRQTMIASSPDAVGNYDLWTYDLVRGSATRFTSDPGGEYYGVWSADGKSVIFNSTRSGHYDLYRKAANGTGPEELLYADGRDMVPNSWSHDGKHLLYFTGGGRHYQLWKLSLTPPQPGAKLKAEPLLNTRFDEWHGQFSPDDRWVSYSTDESGRVEVYAALFARPTEKHQVSSAGGSFGRWRKDGKAIFYQGRDGQLREAEIRITGEKLDVISEHAVFGNVRGSPGGYPFDIVGGEQRALLMQPVGKGVEPITIVENWASTLK